MATLHRFPVPDTRVDDGMFGHLTHLLRLELELGLAEARAFLVSAAVAIAVAVAAAIALIVSIVVLIAGAFAPAFGAHWEHFVVAGGGVAFLAMIALAWSAWRLRTLRWPRQTITSFEENWRWLGAQLRSRLTLR